MKLFHAADLTYNVVEQTLKGKIGKTAVSAHAVSGGRAGSKKANATNNFLANNPFFSGVKKRGNIPGGAIPLVVHPLNQCEIWDGCNAETLRRTMAAPAAPNERMPMVIPVGRGTCDGILDFGPAFEATPSQGQ